MSRVPSRSASRRGAATAAAGASWTPFALGLGALMTLLVAGLLGFQAARGEKIAPGVVALGTPVGGLTRAEAAARLGPNTDSLLSRPLRIRFGDRAWDTTARELGLRLDAGELIDAAYRVGRQGSPFAQVGEQWSAWSGGRNVAVSSTTDQAALEAALTRIAREVERPPQDARLSLNTAREGTFQFTPGQTGLAVDVTASRERLAQALVSPGASPSVELVVRETPPAITNEMLQPAREQLERLLGAAGAEAPLTLTFGRQKWPLERADVLKLLSLEGGTRPGQPMSVKIDEAPLRALATKLGSELSQDVQDARLNFVNGALKVLRESKDGRALDQAATVALVKQKLLAGERTAELPVSVTKPAVASDDLKALGIVELMDRGMTSFAGSIPEKQYNIKLAAERLNGYVVPPGATFSFNKAIGPTTLEAGFKWGFGITTGQDGGARTVPSVAGGICQVATTLFQPVFWSGLPLEERYSHLYWIPAYTSRGVVGLDVTVDEEAGLDFQWVNTTDSYILVQSAADEANVYFSLYGKKPTWKVEVDDPAITNRTPPDTKPVAEPEPSLPWGRTLAVETAREGFDVVVTRTVTPPNGEPRTLTLKSTYQPARTVTLVGTGGKPADAKVEDAIARVLGAQAATTGTPVASGTPAASGSPSTSGPPSTSGTPAATNRPAPTSGAAPTSDTPATRTPAAPPAAPTATPQAAPAAPVAPVTATLRAPAPPAPTVAPTSAPKPQQPQPTAAPSRPPGSGGASGPVPVTTPRAP